MTKINSKYIKDNVKCWCCGEGGKKLKRTHKQSFKSPMNSDLEIKPEKFELGNFTSTFFCFFLQKKINKLKHTISIH